ncbi:ATP-dependent DNA helicase RecQ [Ventosimonas gracilis]|uniref:DNA helicase RecQ n=1 Tax=Ventosimonas gracilis TaxID=1680762 RepID=A0A139SXW9_9GAMM|nr:DNA helicase RecQ [Ventosimonas gracilis]KXU39478.1 ATP-dependent DNA helicase RecQ [Ventosimonas gracilis]
MSKPSAALRTLKAVFGYEQFRGQQQAIIDCLLAGQDALVLMPTGGGKSLCYQLPALLRDGLAVVVSPLIALMADQIAALDELGVSAVALNSTQSAEQQREIAKRLREGTIKLLYLAPERLVQPRMLSFLQSLEIALIAIDEAHCVSQWGHDFRPEYLQLGPLAQYFKHVPRIALTATADKRTREEIATRLQLNNPQRFVASFDRPNIFYRIVPKTKSAQQLLDFLKGRKGEAGIVYCLSRKKVENTAEMLVKAGYPALPYHAGLESDVRAANQRRFLAEDGLIMVATIAFGMGIDKPNVRFVAHLDLPKSLEAYYQETGRAGRDGLPADAWMAYGLSDVIFLKERLQQSEGSEAHKRLEQHKLNAMLGLCEMVGCRRQALLAYFDEQLAKPCGHCDNCLEPPQTFDATEAARQALSAVYRSGSRYGANHLIEVLRGSRSEKVKNAGHDKLSVFGIGKALSDEQWRSLFRQLVVKGLVDIDDSGYGGLRLTEDCRPLLRGEVSLALRRENADKKRHTDSRHHALIQPQQQADWDKLRRLRKQLADEHGVPPYVIFHDATLIDMLEQRPKTLSQMALISGVGAHKLERYGQAFLQVLNGGEVTIDLRSELIRLAEQGMPPGQIAEQLKCSEKTLWRLLSEAIGKQQLTLQVLGVTPALLEAIQDAFLEGDGELPAVSTLAPHFAEQVPEGVLHCIRSALQAELAG